jgi:hypothetical protein
VPRFEHHLFLSATPRNGYEEPWTALLELLDRQRFRQRASAAAELSERALLRVLTRAEDQFGTEEELEEAERSTWSASSPPRPA